jgi:hypothetical protein
MIQQVVQHGEPVAHATGAAGEIHDQRLGPDAGQAARKSGRARVSGDEEFLLLSGLPTPILGDQHRSVR